MNFIGYCIIQYFINLSNADLPFIVYFSLIYKLIFSLCRVDLWNQCTTL